MKAKNETMLQRFMHAWSAHDVDGIMSDMTEDIVFEPRFGSEPWGARYEGAAAVRAGIEKNFRDIPDLQWQPFSQFVYDDHAVVEWLTTGTPKSGKPFKVHGCDILFLRDGKVAIKRAYGKTVL